MNVSDRVGRRVSRLLGGIAALGAAYYYLLGGEFTLRDMGRLEEALDAQTAELAGLEARRDSLRARADSLENDPAAIERVAREVYGFLKPGEIVVRFVDGTAGLEPEDGADPRG